MKRIIYCILVFVFIFNYSCIRRRNCHKFILLKNNSEKIIYVDVSNKYPDTIFPSYYQNPLRQPYLKEVLPYSKNEGGLERRSCYEAALKGPTFPHGIIMFYVFDSEVLETIPWETVKEKNMILRRYDLSLGDLQSLNWEIPYPPSEAMKNMKMYPPYGE